LMETREAGFDPSPVLRGWPPWAPGGKARHPFPRGFLRTISPQRRGGVRVLPLDTEAPRSRVRVVGIRTVPFPPRPLQGRLHPFRDEAGATSGTFPSRAFAPRPWRISPGRRPGGTVRIVFCCYRVSLMGAVGLSESL
jgi:hypothetical protein